MILAAICAVAVASLVVSYTNNLRQELGGTVPVLRVTADVPPFEEITEEMIEVDEVPAAGFSDHDIFLSSPDDLAPQAGQLPVSTVFLNEGTMLQENMLDFAPDLGEGEREIAIMVNAETGVAGKIDRGSLVDVYGLQQGSEDGPPCAVRILTQQTVLEIGELVSETDAETGLAQGVVPVTFKLTPQDTLRLTYAEGFMGTLRLGLVSPQGSGDPGEDRYCADTDEQDFDDAGDHGPSGDPLPELDEDEIPDDPTPAEEDAEEDTATDADEDEDEDEDA